MHSVKTKTESKTQDVSWPLLLTVATVVVGSTYLLSHNVLYTDGEVTQGLFTFLVILAAGSVLLGFHRRKIAIWCVMLLGGIPLLWQTYQSRKWAIIHEDIVGIVRFVEDARTKTGRYPANLDGYAFKNGWVKSHIYGFGPQETEEFRLTYFINDPGISYWYSSKTGFGYYPD
jgi:hypothetical protein